LNTEIERVVSESYTGQDGLALQAPDGFVGIGIHQVVQARTADDKLKGRRYAGAIRNASPSIVRFLAGSMEAEAAGLVIENVLKAREADEAGDARAARAFMALAASIYRAAWSPRGGRTPSLLNREIARLVADEHPDEPGLHMTAPEGLADICHFSKKQVRRSRRIDFALDDAAPWSCAEVGGNVLRVSEDEVSAVSDGVEGMYEVGIPILIAVGQDENAVPLDHVLDLVRLRGPRKPGRGSDYYANVTNESCFGSVGNFPTIMPVVNDRSSKQLGPMGDIFALAEYPADIRVRNMTFTGTTCVVDGTPYRIYAGGAE